MRPISLVLTVSFLGCGDTLSLEGAVNHLCQKLSAQRFAVPKAVTDRLPDARQSLPSPVTVSRTFDFDVTAKLPDAFQGAEIAVSLERLTLTAGQEMPDLRFVDAAQVTLEPPPASSLPKHVVVRAASPTARTLLFEGQDVELVPYLQSGVLSYTVALTAGSTPPPDMTADIDACANVVVRWNYGR